MNHDSKLGSKIKRQISRFASHLGEGMDKVTRRFVGEMLYGMQASKDVKASEAARLDLEVVPGGGPLSSGLDHEQQRGGRQNIRRLR